MIYIIASTFILIALARLWAGESCRRQDQRDDLRYRGVTSGPEWDRANAEFFK